MKPCLILLLLPSLVAGCVTPYGAPGGVMATQEYKSRTSLTTSLFKSDQEVMSDEAISRILSSKIQLPPKAKIALMRFGSDNPSYYRGYYWIYSETYLKLQQEYMDTLASGLSSLPRVVEVTPLPSLMTPASPTIPMLREAAVRLQADMLLVFRITTDLYQEYNVFSKDEAKAYSTCELVLLDVRTGVIPFTSVTTRDFYTRQQEGDLNLAETVGRAEKQASLTSLALSSQRLLDFLRAVP